MPQITVKPTKSYSHFKESVKRFKEICDSPVESDEYQEAVMLGNIIRDYEKGCPFSVAIEALEDGAKIKVPEWKGYWFKESGIVKVMTAEGKVLDTPHFQQYIFRKDWIIM